jgi:glycosyltransferase involved in cell wall biosynthesis
LRLTFVIPVFDDWESLAQLIGEIDQTLSGGSVTASLIVVNDGSGQPPPDTLGEGERRGAVQGIEILNLAYNMGSQRAIALGLREAARRGEADAVVVMDADGEDRPEDIPKLIALLDEAPDAIVVALRAKRSEGVLFTILYAAYKLMFRVLTGKIINFGNFSVIPARALERLVQTPEVWNHLAAAYVRSPLPIRSVPTNRGKRYAGRSNMNLPSLVLHGIGAMSVFADILFSRLLIACSGLAGLSVIAVVAVIVVRFLTDLAIPGWATNALGFLGVLFIQLLILMLSSVFLLLNSRPLVSVTPATLSDQLIAGRAVLRDGE